MEKEIRLAMVGMVDGNGHPYSWSAICNGYDEKEMAKCPYPVIPVYLGRQPRETLRIPGVRVTHIWTDDPEDAKRVAASSLIPHVVKRPEDVIGQVDGVMIPTDKGWEHVERARPFIEAGLPLFIDKPLCDNAADLEIFLKWKSQGKRFLSSSSMRYSEGYEKWRQSTEELGSLRFACITTPKSWERYGIHALEGVYAILGPGFVSVRNTGDAKRNLVHLKHRNGADVVIAAIDDMTGSFGDLLLCGTKGSATAVSGDTYVSFRRQLESFTGYVRTGNLPFDFQETVECMRIIIAGITSRNEGGREISLV